MMFLVFALAAALLQIVSTERIVNSGFLFNANQPFLDLSVNNFENISDSVYTYALKARPGAKVSIYFLTVPTDNCVIELFDGVDENAARVNTSTLANIPNIIGQIFPKKLTSTSQNFFLRVTSLPKRGADFQAIATDYENNADCGKELIFAVGGFGYYPVVEVSKTLSSCVRILRIVDTTNNRGTLMRIQEEIFDGSMYKGLVMQPENKLQNLKYFYVTDRNVIFETAQAAKFTISFTFPDKPVNGHPAVISTGMVLGQKQTVMTVDFIPYRTINGITKQTYVIMGQEYVNRTQISFLNNIGSANVEISAIKANKDTVTKNYTQATLPTEPIIFDMQELVIEYTGDAATAKGLYVLVSDATVLAGQSKVIPSRIASSTTKYSATDPSSLHTDSPVTVTDRPFASSTVRAEQSTVITNRITSSTTNYRATDPSSLHTDSPVTVTDRPFVSSTVRAGQSTVITNRITSSTTKYSATDPSSLTTDSPGGNIGGTTVGTGKNNNGTDSNNGDDGGIKDKSANNILTLITITTFLFLLVL